MAVTQQFVIFELSARLTALHKGSDFCLVGIIPNEFAFISKSTEKQSIHVCKIVMIQ